MVTVGRSIGEFLKILLNGGVVALGRSEIARFKIGGQFVSFKF